MVQGLPIMLAEAYLLALTPQVLASVGIDYLHTPVASQAVLKQGVGNQTDLSVEISPLNDALLQSKTAGDSGEGCIGCRGF